MLSQSKNSQNITTAQPRLPPGSRFCLCRRCGQTFLTLAAFDAHRILRVGLAADRSCETTPYRSELNLTIDARGYWRLPKREYISPARRCLRVVS